MQIAQLGQPVLRQVAQPIGGPEEVRHESIQHLIDTMIQTMLLTPGSGLAAPQLFVSRRVFVARVLPFGGDDELADVGVFVDPQLEVLDDTVESEFEGCLSFPELKVLVPRHRQIRIDFLDREGQQQSLVLEGQPARVVQHEQDHLDGILTIDRAESTRHIVKSTEAAIARAEWMAKQRAATNETDEPR